MAWVAIGVVLRNLHAAVRGGLNGAGWLVVMLLLVLRRRRRWLMLLLVLVLPMVLRFSWIQRSLMWDDLGRICRSMSKIVLWRRGNALGDALVAHGSVRTSFGFNNVGWATAWRVGI